MPYGRTKPDCSHLPLHKVSLESPRFLKEQCRTIRHGLYKGYKDTRTTRCYDVKCHRGHNRNCNFCRYFPYVPSPLKQENYSKDSDDCTSVEAYNYTWTTNDEVDYTYFRDQSNNCTQVKLSGLLTEISSLSIFDDENYKLNNKSTIPNRPSWDPAQSGATQSILQHHRRNSTWIQPRNIPPECNITDGYMKNDSWVTKLYVKFNQKRKKQYP